MSQTFIQTCPYCETQLSISRLPVEKTVSRCPKCKKYILIDEYGQSIRKPHVYICPKCGQENIYDGRPQFVKCEKCQSFYVTSIHGVGMIDLHLLSQGDKGELTYKKKKDRYITAINKWLSLSKATKIRIFSAIAIVFILAVGGYIISLPPSIETTKAYAQMDSLWNEFSKNNPYNIQIECIKSYDDNSKIVLLSEPSDFVSEQMLIDFFEPYNSYVKTYKRKIGFDGWMKDFVVAFNDLDESDYKSFEKDLSKLLYCTDYKASLLNLSTMIEHVPYLDNNLNYNVTSEELRKWFIDDLEPIRLLEDTASDVTNISSVLEGNIVGNMQLYTSVAPGFIIWVFDTSDIIDELPFRINARKFSLDSDLILGAISNGNNVAIIARERCIPITQLPPMRPETLCLLSNTVVDELSQSYERNNIFAGKQSGLSGGKDYAPILLSDALWHTEYGNIMNVTDQMLKSWSENGMIDYVDFNYPKPVFWGFDKGVLADLNVTELTYNWNTDGVGYIVEDSTYSVYALNRTGSLPVSYIPGDATQIGEQDPVYQAEQKAYDFFSSLSNPELAKVVQYASMYQIFYNFGIQMRYDNEPSYDDYKFIMPHDLVYESVELLKKIGKYGSVERDSIARYYNASITTEEVGLKIGDYNIVSRNTKLPTTPLGLLAANYFVENLDSTEVRDLNYLFYAADLIIQVDTLHYYLKEVIDDNDFIRTLGEAVIDRNKIVDIIYRDSDSPDNANIFINNTVFNSLSKEEKVQNAFDAVFTKEKYIKSFAEIFSKFNHNKSKMLMVEANANRNRAWMKTPTVVESWSLVDSVAQLGGHNLSSNVTRFRVADDLKPGQTRELTVNNNSKIIEVSRSDSRFHISSQSYLRKVGRLNDIAIEGKVVEIRPRNIVTDVAIKRSSRGFNSNDHTIIIGEKTFVYANKKYESLDMLINDFCNSNTTGEVLSINIECLKGSGVTPKMIINNINCRLRRGNTNLPMSKFDFSHATQQQHGDNVFFTIPIRPGKMDMGSTSLINRAGLGGSSNVGLRVNVYEGNIVFKVYNQSKLHTIVKVLKEFFANTKGYFNELRLRNLFKRYGIEIGTDVECTIEMKINSTNSEKEFLMISKIIRDNKNTKHNVQFYKEEKVA